MILSIYEDTPNNRSIIKVASIMKNDGVIIYPTDTGYALGASLFSRKATDMIRKLKGISHKKRLSFICSDLKQIGHYAELDNNIFKIFKQKLPGPYTFIVNATKNAGKFVVCEKKRVGIRMAFSNFVKALIEELSSPLISTSLNSTTDVDMLSDPEIIEQIYGSRVDIICSAGIIYPEFSTIVDFTGDEYLVLREGKGEIDF